jgi:hypothetical protein
MEGGAIPMKAFPAFSDEDKKKTTALESIGTKQEKTIHRAIKYYLCPDEQCHEFKIGRFIADIYRDGAITEIQTGSFRSMKAKLRHLLPDYRITVVYPVIRKKTIHTIDEMGLLSAGKRSPKTGNPLSIGKELTQIRDFLADPHLDFVIFFVDCDEYRAKTVVKAGRKDYDRIEQVPHGEPVLIPLKTADDFRVLLPAALPAEFTAKEFRKATRLGARASEGALQTGKTLGIIRQTGKIGRAFLYRIEQNKDDSSE